jgi:hypothetical protein
MTPGDSESAPYASAWREYRRRRVAFLVAWLGVPMVGFFVSVVVDRATKSHALGEAVFLVAGAVAALLFFFTSVRFTFWRCPRCGKLFFKAYWWNNPFAQKCLHCGLPKYARGPDGIPLQAP